MQLLEIIHIRSALKNIKSLKEYLHTWVGQYDSEQTIRDIRIYKHMNIETDFSIHLYFEKKEGSFVPAEQLVSSLKDFGLVNHSLWTELDKET